jgi:hypothetical protein|tara:strand:- start:376 stop:591 length:216 start_codon:yes stop_codon:yes gene_type:complete
MDNNYLKKLTSKKIFLRRSNEQNVNSNSKKVDINILLNRVKIDQINEKKNNFIFAASILISLILSAYIIFN